MSGGLIFGNCDYHRGMKGLSLKEFYAQSMELKAPWNVADLRIDGESRQVRIRVECACGEIWGDPETNARAEIKDWEERTVTASVPWAAPRGRFTLSFEVHVGVITENGINRTLRVGNASKWPEFARFAF